MTLPTITATGRLGSVELRFTPTGLPVARLRVACDDRRRTDTGWETVGTTWLDVTCWRQLAENVADSLDKGDEVTVTGRLRMREYEVDGTKRTAYEVDADQVAATLGRATAQLRRPDRHDQHTTTAGSSGGDPRWDSDRPAPF